MVLDVEPEGDGVAHLARFRARVRGRVRARGRVETHRRTHGRRGGIAHHDRFARRLPRLETQVGRARL